MSSKNRAKYSQNFVKDNSLIAGLLKDSSITLEDHVIEIGAGRGVITKELAKVARSVTAYEVDGNFVETLKIDFAGMGNIEIKGEDFMSANLPNTPYKVFANIPFKYSSEIVQKLVQLNSKAVDIYLFVQGEFYDRVAGYPNESLFSLSIKPLYKVDLQHEFSRLDFVPAPSVDVVLMHLKSTLKDRGDSRNHNKRMSNSKYLDFRDFAAFMLNSHKANLMGALNLLFTPKQISRLSKDLKLDTKGYVSELNYDQWTSLYEFFSVGVDRQKQKQINKAYLKHRNSQKGMKKVNRARGRWSNEDMGKKD
jgi:23S rRNA (adenine-N6)-dimethyltransferase